MMMKKILLVAASFAALSGTVAQADHNYAGLGVGYTIADGRYNNSNTLDVGAAHVNAHKRGALKDTSAFSGTLFLGRSYDLGNKNAWLVELKAGMDSTKANHKSKVDYIVNPGAAPDIYNYEYDLFLKRRFTVGLGVGYSAEVMKDVDAYVKMSLLLSNFRLTVKEKRANNNAAQPNADGESITNSKYALGFSPTVGISRKFKDFSVNFDYSFEMYRSIKYTAQYADAPGALGGDNGFVSKVKPRYHTFMVSLVKPL